MNFYQQLRALRKELYPVLGLCRTNYSQKVTKEQGSSVVVKCHSSLEVVELFPKYLMGRGGREENECTITDWKPQVLKACFSLNP